jgi:hypothetical protein
LKSARRKVPQKIYRPAHSGRSKRAGGALSRMGGVRVKRCGKSAPPPQQCGGQGKPHTEQDQIGRDPAHSGRSVIRLRLPREWAGTCRLGASPPPGRSLEPRSNAWPRGMTVLLERSGRQNSAYRSGCHIEFEVPRLRSGFRLRSPAALTSANRLNLQARLPTVPAVSIMNGWSYAQSLKPPIQKFHKG